MERPYQHIDIQRHGDVYYVRLRARRLLETEILETADELVSLIIDGGCRKLALSLGPEPPECLYSIFLAKLVSIQRRLNQAGGVFKLAHVSPEIFKIFEACRLQTLFEFCPDQKTALADFAKS